MLKDLEVLLVLLVALVALVVLVLKVLLVLLVAAAEVVIGHKIVMISTIIVVM